MDTSHESVNLKNARNNGTDYTQLLENDGGSQPGKQDDKISGKGWGRVAKFFGRSGDYPSCVFLIVGNEFCERFSYYGLRTILVLYLTQRLMFDENTATALYHGFVVLCYFSPLFGAMIADGWLGKYRTILYISALYCVGNAIVSLTAFPPPEIPGPVIGLVIVGLGTGGIKPCVAAFGGDQFTEKQDKQRTQFFSVFYFAINAGSVLSTFFTPILRADVQCFGGDCYPLAFGVPAVLMIVALIIFVFGRNLYKKNPASGNIIGDMICSIARAIRNKCSRGSKMHKDHWLYYANDKYDTQFLSDVKDVLHVLLLFIPLPVFWALFDQMGSRWTLQAGKMDGHVFGDWHIKADQIQVINPILILTFIPLFESIIYPLLDKCRVPNRPLQRMVAGMLLASGSFVIAGFLQITIDKNMPAPLLSGDVDMRLLNIATCPVNISSKIYTGPLDSINYINNRVAVQPLNVQYEYNCGATLEQYSTSLDVPVVDRHAYTIVFNKGRADIYSTTTTKPKKKKVPTATLR